MARDRMQSVCDLGNTFFMGKLHFLAFCHWCSFQVSTRDMKKTCFMLLLMYVFQHLHFALLTNFLKLGSIENKEVVGVIISF